jgi:hypothetical protein
VSGRHDGNLAVTSGVLCLAPGATVTGQLAVNAGTSLYAFDASVGGPVVAQGGANVVLVHTTVTRPLAVTGTTGELSVEDSRIGGFVAVTGNAGPKDGPPLVSADVIGGMLTCSANDPSPVDNGLPNTAGGGKDGQCRGL